MRSDGAWAGVSDETDATVQWRNGAADRDASGELTERILLSGEAAFDAFHEPGVEALMKNDVLWTFAYGEAFL